MRSPCADGVAQPQRRRVNDLGEEGAVDGKMSVVLNPAAMPEEANRRSNDERKIRAGGTATPWCCDAEVKIVMGGVVAGGSEIIYFAIF